jgi:hypothetical protein
MKECKYGKIPPCYGSLERAIYEEAKKVNDEWKKSRALHGKILDKLRGKLMEGGFLDDTHDKVYELNRQMCDIDKHLSEAGYFGMICEGQVEARKKLKDMEEKKTKKMTKAEAFEWLKCKKVNTKGKGEEVQTKLFECGFSWVNGQCRYYDFSDYLLFEDDGKLWHCGEVGDSYWKLHNFEEISADDILSIEIVDEKKCSEEDGLDLISTVGSRLSEVLRRMEGHKHIVITEDDVILYDEGMSLFHSDPF